MPRLLVAALVGAAFVILGNIVPRTSLVTLPEFHPRLAISVSLTF